MFSKGDNEEDMIFFLTILYYIELYIKHLAPCFNLQDPVPN